MVQRPVNRSVEEVGLYSGDGSNSHTREQHRNLHVFGNKPI